MSTERNETNLPRVDTTVENKQIRQSEESPDSPSESSSSDGDGDPAYVPLAQKFPSSESSEEEEEGEKESRKRPKEPVRIGLGLFQRGVETARSIARKRRRFGSLKQPDEPAHIRRQKREYYDSDNSYEGLQAPGYDKFKADTVDYYELAARPSCDDPIFNKMQEDEVSELIGYATDPKAQASLSVPLLYAGLPAMLNDMSDSVVPTTIGQSLAPHAASTSGTSAAVNPLLGLPSTPLPTSHLEYISKLASDGLNLNKPLRETVKRGGRGRPSRQEVSVYRGNNLHKLENRFSDSALVATGMLVEEMITASLMPLAGYHVMRCRELEARRDNAAENDEDANGVHYNTARRTQLHPLTGKVTQSNKLLVDPLEKPGEEWTLPPGEAMMKLLQQDVIPPEGLHLTPPATQTLGDPNQVVHEPDQHGMHLFSKDNKMDAKNVVDNMDIYRLFLRMKNYKDISLNPPPGATRRRGRQPRQESLELDTDLEDAEEFDSDE